MSTPVHRRRTSALGPTEMLLLRQWGETLYGANLSRANLSGADLYGANLSRAVSNQWTRLPAGWVRDPDGWIVAAVAS